MTYEKVKPTSSIPIGSLCRFDHVAKAMEALTEYTDICAARHDTKAALGIALSSIQKLLVIEEKVIKEEGKEQIKSSPYLSVTIAELEGEAKKLQPTIDGVEYFLAANEKIFSEAKKEIKRVEDDYRRLTIVFRKVETIRASIRAIYETRKQLRKVDLEIRKWIKRMGK